MYLYMYTYIADRVILLELVLLLVRVVCFDSTPFRYVSKYVQLDG